MKFDYIYSVDETVVFQGKSYTIKSRCGRYDTPHYFLNGYGKAVPESELNAYEPTETTETEATMDFDRSEYIEFLKLFDLRHEQISKYSRNLNLLSAQNELNPTYNRDEEISKIKTILLRRTKPNPLLVGVAGCGKTAIVEGLAKQYVDEALKSGDFINVPIIYDLSLNSTISGAKYRGDFENVLKQILELLSENRNIIVFIDEIHVINEIGSNEGTVSAGQILKPALARGEIRCIGATTTAEYKKYIANDKALARRFSNVEISPLMGKTRLDCIGKILAEYGEYFSIDVTAVNVNTLNGIIEDVIPNTVFPDNVIDIIDETLATAKFNGISAISDTEIKQTVSRQHNILIV